MMRVCLSPLEQAAEDALHDGALGSECATRLLAHQPQCLDDDLTKKLKHIAQYDYRVPIPPTLRTNNDFSRHDTVQVLTVPKRRNGSHRITQVGKQYLRLAEIESDQEIDVVVNSLLLWNALDYLMLQEKRVHAQKSVGHHVLTLERALTTHDQDEIVQFQTHVL